MEFFVFRNFTVENLFRGLDVDYSGYGDISVVPEAAKSFVWFYLPPINPIRSELVAEVRDFGAKLQFTLDRIPKHKPILAFTLISVFDFKPSYGDYELEQAINDYNNLLFSLKSSYSNLRVLNTDEFRSSIIDPFFDWRYYYISQSIINPKLNKSFHAWFLQKLELIKNKRRKCLVLDLDNTLWGGVLGEDGIEGIKIGNTYPGSAFKDFQISILEAARNGVILAVCSKNNETDVLELWEKHPFQLIQKKHLAAYRINWQDKPSNIVELASELNIGLDSFVFIDDNPTERERVKLELPMVAVPDFPTSPFELPEFFNSVYQKYFNVYGITEEDKVKNEQYLQNSQRQDLKRQFASIDDYLASLHMELRVLDGNELTVPRIAQMTQKTNQFNLTTKRYTEGDLYGFINKGHLVNCLSVRDRFGDNGITVASIITIDGDSAHFDSFLLSCRILGRNIETAYINYLLNMLIDKGVKKVSALFIPTHKNMQTSLFYEGCGFFLFSEKEDGSKHYQLELKERKEIKEYFNFTI